jgi:ABC-type branched-subunit amino acid transport system ATPase component
MLEVKDLHSGYGDAVVVRGASLEVRPGEIVALLGRNGMGKTTFIRSIMGLTPPQVRSGTITWRDARAWSVCVRMISPIARSRSCRRGAGCFRR